MDFVALVAHGLSAISVFRERVGTRLLVGAVAGAGLLAVLFAGLAVLAAVYGRSVPIWVWVAATVTAIVTFESVLVLFVLAFTIVAQRDLLGFLPIPGITAILSMTANDSADASYTYIDPKARPVRARVELEALLDGADPAVPSRACSGGWCGYRIEYGGARRHGTRDWTCLEPDAELAGRLARRLSDAGLAFRVVRGTTADIPDEERFDCALYIDVLEHIADDRAELRRVSARLRPGGRLIVLAATYQFLFSAFDEAVGYRPLVLAKSPAHGCASRARRRACVLSGSRWRACLGRQPPGVAEVHADGAAAQILGQHACSRVAAD